MPNKNGNPSNSKTKYSQDGKEIAPPTIAQRIQATRIMGYIGGVLFAGFLLTIAYSIFENAKTIKVDGIVTDITSKTNDSGRIGESDSTSYRHKFRYRDADGVEHIGNSVGSNHDSSYPLGAVVSIGYYPDDFSKVRIRSWFGLWKYQLVLFGLGLVLIIYSIWGVKQIRIEEKTEVLSSYRMR